MKENLVAVEHKDPSFTNITKVEWFIGLGCNFDCTYCAEYNRSGFAKKEDVFKAVDNLKSNLKEREIKLLLGGGEPSIYKHILETCEYIHSKNIELSMISNGSRDPKLYLDMLDFIEHYTFSLHPEMDYYKTLNTIEQVSQAIQTIDNKSLLVHVMMVPGYFDVLKKIISDFSSKNIRFILRRIRPLFKDNKPILPKIISSRPVYKRDYNRLDLSAKDWGYYNEEELSFLDSQKKKMSKNTREFWRTKDGTIRNRETNANEILIRKDNRFEGWSCYVGIERLHIYPNGDVYRSTCKVGGKLGNIYDSFIFPDSPVICTKKRCTCAWAVNLSKTKEDKYFSLLQAGRR